MNKRLTGRYPSITVAAYGYAVGTLLLLLLVVPLRAGSADAWVLRYAGCVALAYADVLLAACCLLLAACCLLLAANLPATNRRAAYC